MSRNIIDDVVRKQLKKKPEFNAVLEDPNYTQFQAVQSFSFKPKDLQSADLGTYNPIFSLQYNYMLLNIESDNGVYAEMADGTEVTDSYDAYGVQIRLIKALILTSVTKSEDLGKFYLSYANKMIEQIKSKKVQLPITPQIEVKNEFYRYISNRLDLFVGEVLSGANIRYDVTDESYGSKLDKLLASAG